MKKLLTTIILLILLLVSTVCIVIYTASRDIPAPNMQDLAPERPEVTDENNAFTYFKQASEQLVSIAENESFNLSLCEENPNNDILEEILAIAAPAMELVEQGLVYEVCLAPEMTSFDQITSFPKNCRLLARAGTGISGYRAHRSL